MLQRMSKVNAIELARQLVQTNTENPPGKEAPLARILGPILEAAGFRVESHEMEPGRPNLVARIGSQPFLCLTGHMDTVPADPDQWTRDPFGADIEDGLLYGLGSSDMKSGVAAIVAAACGIATRPIKYGGLVLVLTAAEETGCQGAEHLAGLGVLGTAGAMLIAEPTGMEPFVGHKGAMWVRAVSQGKAAHGSRPEEGVNAIYKAARAISRIADYKLSAPAHPILGSSTISVGTIQGGVKTNVVPAKSEFSMDLRLIPGQKPDEVLAELRQVLGPEADILEWKANEALMSDPADPWIAGTIDLMEELSGRQVQPGGASYFTDGVALSRAMGNPPALVLGPGRMAHQADEHCPVSDIELAAQAYNQIMRAWLGI
jgi:succinyl-diaminopimelate desuccinylase